MDVSYPEESFDWTYEFMLRVNERVIFPGKIRDTKETMREVRRAINGLNPEAAIVPDPNHGGNKLIFPIKGKLVTFPFVVTSDRMVVIKTAFYSQGPDIELYKSKKNIKHP